MIKNSKKIATRKKECSCVQSVDIWIFNAYKHFCTYCYANFSKVSIMNKAQKYLKR